MTGADIGVPQLTAVAYILVANHRSIAVWTPYKPLQNVLAVFQVSKLAESFVVFTLSLLGNLLNFLKSLAVDNRLVGIPDDNPVGFVHIGLPLSLIEGLLLSTLNHVTYVNRVCQYAL